VQTKGFYVDGKEDGRYTVYYSNGNVRYTGVYNHGEKVGEWRFYNEDGELERTETF
jgi:antitoxin component YwqK of YwqJK toxin-antitoxin module